MATTNNFNKTDTFKSSTRYSSLSSHSSSGTLRTEKSDNYNPSYSTKLKYNTNDVAKSHKKSYDSTTTTNAKTEGVKFYESPRKALSFKDKDLDRNSLKSKDFKDMLHRGAFTPSNGQYHMSIMEKMMESKYRKWDILNTSS